MTGSKNQAKPNWRHGRTGHSFRKEVRLSLKKNKKYLNRKVRHTLEMPDGCAYKKLAKDRAYEYLS